MIHLKVLEQEMKPGWLFVQHKAGSKLLLSVVLPPEFKKLHAQVGLLKVSLGCR